MSDLQSSTQRELKVISFCEIIAARSTKCNNVFFSSFTTFHQRCYKPQIESTKNGEITVTHMHESQIHSYTYIQT